MRALVVYTFQTLDGDIQAPGGSDEDRDGSFRHGGWLVPYFDEKFEQSNNVSWSTLEKGIEKVYFSYYDQI